MPHTGAFYNAGVLPRPQQLSWEEERQRKACTPPPGLAFWIVPRARSAELNPCLGVYVCCLTATPWRKSLTDSRVVQMFIEQNLAFEFLSCGTGPFASGRPPDVTLPRPMTVVHADPAPNRPHMRSSPVAADSRSRLGT